VPEPLERIAVPGDLIPLGDLELDELHTRVLESFNAVRDQGPGNYTQDDVSYAFELRDGLSRVKAEMSARKVRAEQQAASSKLSAERTMNEINESINGPAKGTPEAAAAAVRNDIEQTEAIAAAAARGVTDAFVKLMGDRRTTSLTQVTERAVASLGQTAQVAPKVAAPPAKLPITAAGTGNSVASVDALADLFISKSNDVPVTQLGREAPRHKVASIRNEFKHTADNNTSPFVIQEIMEAMASEPGSPALTAGGGWCAPNEIRYNFFNIAEEPTGMIDLPTIGVTRGGLQWPVSPAIGDVFYTSGASNAASGFGGFAFSFANTSDPWLWSDTDDQLTVTGAVNKPTLRVPCSTFTSGRLEAYGLTLTAGNLTDSAYPEQTQNFLRLLRMAYSHAINARLISLVSAASTGITNVPAAGTQGAFQTILDAAEMAATDYRNKFAMADDAVLEVVYPRWTLAVMRADLAWRNNVERESVPDSVLRGFFTDRGLRAQFVSDWQVRGASGFGTGRTSWPTAVQFMMYAPGTFLHGQGMSLDLGVVRDSVLNAENDFTAAWAEETHMVAKVGHESRIYTTNYNVNGAGSAGIAATAQL